MPMLEWIARDIKRQTVKVTSQRQFKIPAREVLLQIQSHQLTALSNKDGKCIFVHPTHCVTKYAQMQHDKTCFAYLMRDAKDSTCHLFQAKSPTRVHEIFTAIREAAASSSSASVSGDTYVSYSPVATTTAQQQQTATNSTTTTINIITANSLPASSVLAYNKSTNNQQNFALGLKKAQSED